MWVFLFLKKLYYLTSSAFGASSAFTESTTVAVESTLVESTTTAEESVATSVDAPVPLQAANTASDKIAKIFFIFVFLRLMFLKLSMINIQNDLESVKFFFKKVCGEYWIRTNGSIARPQFSKLLL